MPKLSIAYKKRSQTCPCMLSYHSEGASGADCAACIEHPISIKPMQRVCVPTGVFLQIPEGIEGEVRPRSGLAYTHGVTVINAPGTIDSDYRGELMILLINFAETPFIIKHGDRIAQIVFKPVYSVEFELKQEINSTIRASGGFGSTG